MLEIKDLHVRFHDADHEAVRGIELTVADGEIMGLVGESGSGKTVTAMVVSGLMPRRKADVSGQVLLDGKDLLALDAAQMRRRQGCAISVVFQEPMSAMNPVMRIGPQVEEALRVHTKLSPQERRERALQALRDVDLPDAEAVYDKYPHQMSGGMLQRAMIAAAILPRPKLLLADEPTTALDATIQGQILSLITEQSRKRGMAVLFITHDLGVVARIADNVGVMYAGHLVEHAPTAELFRNPLHPYTRGLMRSAPGRAAMGMQRLPAITGSVPSLDNMPEGCPFAPRCDEALPRCFESAPVARCENGHSVACWAV